MYISVFVCVCVYVYVYQPHNQLDIVVENLGRVNFANTKMPDTNILNKQRKGQH